ncbi:hypothetical protein Acr_26g0004490 [Actinidia rufa]|uniref:VQ domain-containing protein n=1 Tax=Actinidia rufa TaxID=165716 RepID=A0A7J0H294_9ERIC|nr:hypothetical protein Acr_26g0004490 [Actinidia rufa]
MASPSSNAHNNVPSPSSYGTNLPTTTTFVQADPSTFRAVVQRLTGAAQDPSAHKLPVTASARKPTEIGPRRSAFKLHERRQTARKLEIKLGSPGSVQIGPSGFGSGGSPSNRRFLGFGGEMVMVSPVSPLDLFGSPRGEEEEEEERAIAEKGFYFHPSPLSTPRGSDPELLPLFPLHSPRDNSKSSS